MRLDKPDEVKTRVLITQEGERSRSFYVYDTNVKDLEKFIKRKIESK